ncbi:MAG: hypothetical protein ACRDF0_01900 [Candidatus Limnocylindria bacterium]
MSKKVAISLPDELFARLEKAREHDRMDRSGWIQQALRRTLDARQHDADVKAYSRSYEEDPEGPDELEWADAAVRSPRDEDLG